MKNKIGIRREDKDLTEKRAPLTPLQVEQLVREHGVRVVVEPSDTRIFSDEAYRGAGAELSTDLSDCNVIFGVKEVPIGSLLPKKAFAFFSHTIKGQPYNMPMLKSILSLRDTLMDYEKVTDEKGRRLIFFGKFAGYAGMIDTLWALGGRLKWEGLDTPFEHLQQANRYGSLQEAKDAIRRVGEEIAARGLPETLTPLVVGFAGYGHVSQGAQEIFDLLPVEEIPAKELADFYSGKTVRNDRVYKVVFKEEDMVRPRSQYQPFELQDYYRYPEKYEGHFESYLPYLTALVNCIYWEPKYPRLVTKAYLKKVYAGGGQPRLRVIGDITCDIEGSIECNVQATRSTNPIYVYDPLKDRIFWGWEGQGPVVLAVDKLPSELPREATESFGNALLPFVPGLAAADYRKPFAELEIPPEFKRAVIAHNGRLTPDYKYLEEYLKKVE